MSHLTKSLVFVAATVVLFLGYTNCSPGFKSALDNISENASSSFNCLEDPNAKVCLIYKNPVASSGLAIVGGDDLDKLQTQIVSLENLDASGFLQNADVAVYPMKGDRLVAHDGSWKFRYSEDVGASLAQVNAFYYASRTIAAIRGAAGVNYVVSASPLKVITGADRTGFSAADNAIFLAQAPDGRGADLDTGLLIHLVGESYLRTATAGQISNFTNDKSHVACGVKDGAVYARECCTSKVGCSSALAIGQADYVAGISFAQAPAVGESYSGTLSGLVHCDVPRDVSLNRGLTADAAYAACASDGRNGLIYSMGALYASIWWEVRGLAKTSTSGSEMVDRVFFAHLSKLNGSDTFVTAYTKIIDTDKAVNGGQLAALFKAEFTRRGIVVP